MMSKLSLLAIVFVAPLVIASSEAVAEKPAKLAKAFHPEMIGADVAYFEQVTGPARNTVDSFAGDSSKIKTYKISSCDVEAKVAGGTIKSLQMILSPKCTFNLNKFLPNFSGKFPPAHVMTFGQFDSVTRGGGRFYSTCLRGCGNAFDPSVYQHWSGSRADLNLEVMLEVTLVDDPSISASNNWEEPMEKAEGEDWLIDGNFNCTSKYDEVAHKAFRDVRISAITIGHDLHSSGCKP